MNGPYQYWESRWVRRIVVFLLLMTCLRIWIGPLPVNEPASAQVLDPGAQRNQLLAETRRANELLAEIRELMKTHTFNVRVQGADNHADTAAAGPKDR
jgi:hypothetical protein